MTPLNCIAIDDEPHALELLQHYIKKCDHAKMEAIYTDPWKAKERIEKGGIDLIFLDIQMPELTGLQLLDLTEPECAVIITSAYSEYALEGYRYRVSDYLLKPYSFDRFEEAIERVLQKGTPLASGEAEIDHLMVRGDAKGKFHKVRLDQLLYVEALKNYVRFHTESDRIMTLMTMQEVEEQLPESFIRVHRSWIISPSRVEAVEGNTLFVGGKTIPIGRTYKKEVFTRLGLSSRLEG